MGVIWNETGRPKVPLIQRLVMKRTITLEDRGLVKVEKVLPDACWV